MEISTKFVRTKNEIQRISFALLFHNTVLTYCVHANQSITYNLQCRDILLTVKEVKPNVQRHGAGRRRKKENKYY